MRRPMRVCPSSCYRPQRSWGKVMFIQVSMSLLTGGCYPSMHCRWYPSMPCSRSPGAVCSGGVCLVPRGSAPGVDPGLGRFSSGEGGFLLWPSVVVFCYALLLWPSGFVAFSLKVAFWGGRRPPHQKAITVAWWRPPNGYCCGRYASYWNAFLYIVQKTENSVRPEYF